ncbi:hypothetical protein DICVIV_06268 [Dictyocaulus viviparus]|uniref:cGMP-dependent protein kinase interacting domain-containing protein n=1 Tax=Dictyocaulus viviparus TaxID=29172 RepID=A0A0D8XSN2_DICVI|nr:hypothetical protein DICVIV_06268 [Dictyocaulus viviparus]
MKYLASIYEEEVNHLRVWQPSAVTESEAERRNTARIQRQNRRSTQGVSKEHLEEASRFAVVENSRRRASNASNSVVSSSNNAFPTRETAVARLASEERESLSLCSDKTSGSTERSSPEAASVGRPNSEQPSSVDHSSDHVNPVLTTATHNATKLCSLSINQTNVAVRRKGQGLSVSRSTRRSTGPVLPEDIHAAVSVRQASENVINTMPSQAHSIEAISSNNKPVASATSIMTSGSNANVFGSKDGGREMILAETSIPNIGSTTLTSSRNAQARLPGNISVNAFSTPTHVLNARPVEMNLNYKALYEKEKLECEKIRKELEEYKRSYNHNCSLSTCTSRLRTVSSSCGPAPIVKSSSGNSVDDGERRAMERRIADLELQLKKLLRTEVSIEPITNGQSETQGGKWGIGARNIEDDNLMSFLFDDPRF